MQNNNKSKIISDITVNSDKALHVLVLMGGLSAEREVSLISGEAVAKKLIEMGYQVTSVDVGRDISEILMSVKPDVAFNALHGTYGEDGCIQGMLEIMDIPYTHSGVFTSAIAMDKIQSQNLFMMHNIDCPERVVIKKNTDYAKHPLKKPYIIKPANEGSSFGIMTVFEDDTHSAHDYQFEYGDLAIVETFIQGKEINVAIIGQKAIGTLEIEFLKSKFYDFETKYQEGLSKHHCPARLSDENIEKILKISSKIANIIECRGISRAEFRFDEVNNKFYFLEINTHPGFTPLSIVPEIAAYHNISFSELLKILINEALDYHDGKKSK
jgi:D-alanine-D-alanine ligase